MLKFLVGFLPLLALASAHAQFELKTSGKEPHVIIVAEDASPSTRHAAEELRHFLAEITGAELAIVPDTSGMNQREIIVGHNAHLKAFLRTLPDGDTLAKDLEGLGTEGYVLRTLDKHLIIAGAEPRGTLYGVYALLEDHLGCRWFTPEISRIPKRQHIKLPALNERVIPILEYREPFTAECRDGDWCARNRMNSSAASLEERHGGKVRFGAGLFVHTFNILMPPDQWFDTNPEYFSLIDGKRVKDRSQLCCTNEDVIRICTEETLKRIAQDPGAAAYSVSQNDWYNYCQCGPCTDLANAEGSQMGPMLHLVNRVAEAVEKEHPDVAIETLAYQYTRKPPINMRPRDNVIVRLCSIECDFLQPLATSDFEANQEFMRDLEAWAKITDRLWIWDYVTSFRSYLCPYPNLFLRDDNIRSFVENNVTGIFEQDVYNTVAGELSALSGYINAKFLWNPDYDEDTAIDEFLKGVYGKAAPHIRKYIDLLHDEVKENNLHAGIWISPSDAPYLNEKILERADTLWELAEAAVAEDPETLDRVKIARLPVDYAILDRMHTNRQGAYKLDQESLTASVDPAITERAKRFFAVARSAGISVLAEQGPTLDQYETQLADILNGTVRTFAPKEAVRGIEKAAGLEYSLYDGYWESVPDFSKLEPIIAGTTPEPDITVRQKDENYGLRFTGYLDAPRGGMYTLYLRSNDGSRLFIGDELIVNNDGPHRMETRGGVVVLRAGLHPITIEYFQMGLDSGLEAYWEGPGIKHQRIPADNFWHSQK